MDIEKNLVLAAPAQRLWTLLLDPSVMGACVPGMQSIEVISATEYISSIHVKLAFVGARFRIRTTIVEQREPHYLRSESVGEDASIASSLKQASEIFLTEQPDGQTDLRMKIHVDVLGRLGTFGLNAMKTKADRMWEEFAQNLVGRLAPLDAQAALAAEGVERAAEAAVTAFAGGAAPAAPAVPQPAPAAVSAQTEAAAAQPRVRVEGVEIPDFRQDDHGWWSGMLASIARRARPGQGANGRTIHVEIRRADTTITVDWPIEEAGQCAQWLRECLR